MNHRWLNALVKTIILLVVFHVVVVVLGVFFGTNINIFGLRLFWPHWTSNWMNVIIAIIGGVIIYFSIYGLFTKEENHHIEN
jgi:protein-S-isoprenylcysteine O-methyltransferase Ste14